MKRRGKRPKPFWTSADVARVLGVGVSSIKRWTDDKELETIKTVGGHRRYTLAAVWSFATSHGFSTDDLPPVEDIDFDGAELVAPSTEELCGSLVAALRAGDGPSVRRIVSRHAAWEGGSSAFFDRVVGRALELIGEDWSAGVIGVDEEHRASNLLIEWFERLRPQDEAGSDVALLACPPGELHDLPLRMVRLVLEWNGWATDYLGGGLPWAALENAVEANRPRLVLLSARSAEAFDDDGFKHVAGLARRRNALIGIGGQWARGGVRREDAVLRFRSIRGFERWLRSLPPAATRRA